VREEIIKKRCVYKRNYREYKNKKLEEYDNLINQIKENSFDDIIYSQPNFPKTIYTTFDGSFLIRVAFSLDTVYGKKSLKTSRITIEKIGLNTNINKDSKIETLLLENNFKKEEV
jgi:hypothetical protein